MYPFFHYCFFSFLGRQQTMGFTEEETVDKTKPEYPVRVCQCDEKYLWQVYHNERKHRLAVKNYIYKVMENAKNEIPYCNLNPRLIEIRSNMGLSTVQAIYISLLAVYLDEDRERAEGLINAFQEYCPGYESTLLRLYSEMRIPTEVGELRDELAEERARNSWHEDKSVRFQEEIESLNKEIKLLRFENDRYRTQVISFHNTNVALSSHQ